jgi:hypothetical protein
VKNRRKTKGGLGFKKKKKKRDRKKGVAACGWKIIRENGVG